jgi:hypothetical protein
MPARRAASSAPVIAAGMPVHSSTTSKCADGMSCAPIWIVS